VYSAKPVYDMETHDLLYYSETYSFSTYTNKDGVFNFSKPSEFCSLTVVLNTLPRGYGISCQTQFLTPSNAEKYFYLSKVADVDVEIRNGSIIPIIYNKDRQVILADYSVVPANTKHTIDTIDKVMMMDTYEYSGYISIAGTRYPYNKKIDLGNTTTVDKIDYLYTNNVISKSQQIAFYYDLLTTKDANESLECGTALYCSILEYYNSNSDSVLSKSGASLLSTPPYNAYTDAVIGSYTIRVFYDSATMNSSVVSNFASECASVYNYFVTSRSFNAPIPYDDTSYYAIYLVSDSFTTANGYAEPQTGGKSRIVIRYSVVSSGSANYKRTLSHEFSHAMMFAYGVSSISDNMWFHESFASMSALVYYGATQSWFDSMISGYLSRSYVSIFSTTYSGHIYGALVYPLYIYVYLGGWTTIRNIYSNFTSAGNGYDAISNCYNITSYKNAFLASVSCNYKPTQYYAYATSAWGTGSINDFSVPFSGSPNMAVEPMACHYQRFSSSTDIGTAYFTIEIINGSGMMLNKITEDSTGTASIYTVSTSFSRITVTQNNFGGAVKKLTLLPVNTNNSGASIVYQLTASK
jgi:hypothetical protein